MFMTTLSHSAVLKASVSAAWEGNSVYRITDCRKWGKKWDELSFWRLNVPFLIPCKSHRLNILVALQRKTKSSDSEQCPGQQHRTFIPFNFKIKGMSGRLDSQNCHESSYSVRIRIPSAVSDRLTSSFRELLYAFLFRVFNLTKWEAEGCGNWACEKECVPHAQRIRNNNSASRLAREEQNTCGMTIWYLDLDLVYVHVNCSKLDRLSVYLQFSHWGQISNDQ